VRYAPLLTTTLRWSAEDDGEHMRVSVEIPGEASCMGRHANEGVLARLLLMLRLHSAEHACVAKAELAHAAPKCAERVRESLSVDVAFGRGRNSAWFRKELLDAASPVADPALHRVLRGYAEQELAPVDVKRPFSSQVRQRLSLEIRERLPTLFSVAEGLAMSPRTVQAKLAEEESSFAAVLDDVREGIARQALTETELSLWDIAVRLHYSDLSAFVRAFRRWTGTTPAKFRARAA
jgi:AraC-like DNA-binding protein